MGHRRPLPGPDGHHNVPVILILSRTAVKVLKDYTTQRKAGKNPEFKSANVGLEGKTEAWE